MVEGGRPARRRIHVEGAPAHWTGSTSAPPPMRPSGPAGTVGGSPTRPTTVDPARLAAITEATRSRIAGLVARCTAGRVALDALTTRLLDESVTAGESTRLRKARTAADQRMRAGEAHNRELDAHALALDEAVARLAPGAWGGPLETTEPAVSGPAPYCRIGSYELAGRGVPALHSLFDGPGWVVAAQYEAVSSLVTNLALRALAEVPLQNLSFTVFDPRVRGALGQLASLRKVSPSTFRPAVQDNSALLARLEEVLADAAHNAESVIAAGVPSLRELWQRSVPVSSRLNVVVVLDFPTGLDEQVLSRLSSLTSVGGSTGTLLVLHEPNESAASARAVTKHLTRLTWVDGAWMSAADPAGPRIEPDPAPSTETLRKVMNRAERAVSSFQGDSISLQALLDDDLSHDWTASAATSLDAVIGRADDEALTISLRTENPPHPNLLLGGAVGQGKSTVILDLVYSLAARYSPAQLEFYLLDFKQGLEFKRFDADDRGDGWLPHVRAIGLESNQDFGLAVLRHVESDMARRAAAFKELGVTRIDTFVAASNAVMPRLVLVVDEFHLLFEGDDDAVEEAVTLLERIARQGRAYGIHLVLASQTVSGLRALATRGDAIFAQFPLRVSLKNTPAESQAVLSQGNHAAAELSYRGEVVVNRNFGLDAARSNVRGVAAHAPDETLQRIQRELWDRAHGQRPFVFIGSRPAAWHDGDLASIALRPRASGDVELWLGRPIALSAEPYRLVLTNDVDQTLAVVGPDAATARAVLESALASAILSVGRGGLVTVLDGAGEAEQAWYARVEHLATQSGVEVQTVAREEIAQALLGPLAADLEIRRTPTAPVVALGLPRVRGLDAAVPGPSQVEDSFVLPSFDEPVTARTILRRLATEGALAGRPLIGWWPNIRALEVDLGPSFTGVRAFVSADLGLEDLRAIGGPHIRRPQGTPRLGVLDRAGSGALDVVVPFGPLPAEVTS